MPELSTAPLPADLMSTDEEHTFAPASLRYQVEVLGGTQVLDIDARVTIGADPACELRLSDSTVSRRHALLERTPQGVWVKDLGSRNGIFLSDARVDRFLVRRETTFTVGTTLLRVSGVPRAESTAARTSFGAAVGQSPAMQDLFARLSSAASTGASVLLTGETGTGKELLARALHDASPRRHRPFVVVDCGTLAAPLIESELFGHVRGAFTGAEANREGAFATANGGTLFLDEIGELPLELQPRLLRALESRTVRRLGDDSERAIDVRIVAATHRDLKADVRSGRFREDLYFRLAVLGLRVPALRERAGDLPLLVKVILAKMGKPDLELSPMLMLQLERHAWPGNVRELRNVVERAISGGDEEPGTERTDSLVDPVPYKVAKEQLIEAFTREYFTRLYASCGANVTEMARTAGIARTYAHEVVKRYGLKS